MKSLEKFAYAGVLSSSKPSPNGVGIFSPADITTGLEAGNINVQSEVTVHAGSYICSNNTGIIVGDTNPNTGHKHPGHITVLKDSWIGHIGDKGGTLLTLGKTANAALTIKGGKALFGKGNIHGNADCKSTIVIEEGELYTQTIDLENITSSITLRHGLIRASAFKGEFSSKVYGGLLSVDKKLMAGPVILTHLGALVFGPSDQPPHASHVSPHGIDFVENGGALIVKIQNPKGTLSQLHEAEKFFDELKDQKKIKLDGIPITSFAGFKLDQMIGKEGKSYAVLHPVQPEMSRGQKIYEKLLHLFFATQHERYSI